MDQPFFILAALVLASWWSRVPGAAAFQSTAIFRSAATFQDALQAEAEAPTHQALGAAESAVDQPPVDQPLVNQPADETPLVAETPAPGPQTREGLRAGAPTPARRSTARLPSFEEETVEAPDLTPPQRLVIPDLEVDSTIVLKPFTGKTWDIRGLQTDIAWLEGTAHPGAADGNTVLAAHIMVRNIGRGPFRFLDRLKPGARVMVYTQQKVYTYLVREQVVVKETEGEVTMDTGQTQLTLLTCTTWDAKTETYLRRRAVFADLYQVEPRLPEMSNR